MPYQDDKRIEFPVPFLKEGTVLFVGTSPVSEDWILRFAMEGLTLVFIPELAQSVSPDLRQYFFPGAEADLSHEDMCWRIREMAGIGEEEGFLYRRDGVLFFHTLPDVSDRSIDAFLSSFFVVCERSEPQPKRSRLRKIAPMGAVPCEEPMLAEDCVCFSISANEEADDETASPRVRAIIDAWEKIEREFGITIEDLQILLGYKVKLSHLHITTSGKLFLTDFDNQEVKMDDLTKALYFFFLRHPEGARLKELHEHEDEILHIYSGITGRDDTKKIQESVRNLLDPFGNNLNVSMSRIKKAFKDVVSDRVARFYYVDGSYGEVRKVALDRDLVLWAH